MDSIYKEYEELGKRWLKGTEITSFGDFNLNKKQIEFINSKEKEVLISGGFRSGKTVALAIKMWLLCMMFPNNRVLLGRKTLSDVQSATLPTLWDVFPAGTYEYRVGPGIIEFGNGSQILLYGLDIMTSGDDTKKSAQKIKGIDLGGVFIDQLEEVDFKMYELLTSRMSRDVPIHQICATTNPANFWAYTYFKANPRPNTAYVETGMKDNEANLPSGFIEDQISRGDMYARRFVYGEWTPDVFVEGMVFGEDVVKKQTALLRKPLREEDGIKIYEEAENAEYQIGVDPSTGANDPSYVVVINKNSGELAATFTGFVPTTVIVERTVQLAMQYSIKKKPLVVPEITGVGQAFVESLIKVYGKVYEREVYLQRERRNTKKLGFSTNYATKAQLIEHMKELFGKNFPKIRDHSIVEEMKTFVYSDEAKQKGAGAQTNYHDDGIMAMMLAYWNVEARSQREQSLLDRIKKQKPKMVKYQYA